MIATLPHRGSQWAALLLACASAVAGLGLAVHYPLSPTLAVLAWLAAAAVAARWWTRTPLLLLGLLPLIGFAPWTGWLTFEELDLLALACAAGGYAALALRLWPLERAPAWRQMLVYSPLALLLMALMAGSQLLAMRIGFAEAGGWQFGWFQGYHEPMNSLRLGKSLLLVLLLLPLWSQAGACRPRDAARALLWGGVIALAGTSLAALWERIANTGLLNFSTDYRSTALFWEMHVGGAALDGCLVMTLPFAVLALLRARTPWRFGVLMALMGLAAYACLTTFSRGVYLALPPSLAVLVLLRGGQRRRAERAGTGGPGAAPLMSVPRTAKLGGLLLAAGFTLAAALMFGSSGYRGMLALLGAMLVLLAMPGGQWLPSVSQRITALLMGAVIAVLLAALSWVVSMTLPKGAYVAYIVAMAAAVAVRWKARPGQADPIHVCLTAASWFWLLACAVIVANSWGGPGARGDALLAVLGLSLLWPLMLLQPALWPFRHTGSPDWRSRGLLFGGLLLVAAVLASVGGGAYLRERASTWQQDLDKRFEHWSEGLSMLRTPGDWLLGKGTGRFVVNHFFAGPVAQHTGDYRLKSEAGQPYLVLTGGKHPLGWGEVFRVTQRVAAPQGEVGLGLRVRATQDVSLLAEVCEKHLLYSTNCIYKNFEIKAAPGWQQLGVDLGTAPPMGGAWYAPRFVAFSLGVGNPSGMLDIGEVSLRDGSGRMLLANGDFKQELAHWFSSSDRHHLPWHMKNLGLHVLFEQGLLGAALLGLVLLLALWRLSFGRGREHVLAPALAAGLVGFLVVGLFDSLIDAPRLGFLFYAVLLISLGLRALPGAVAEPSK